MYLLDTNVLSETRKAKAGKADRRVMAWADGVPNSFMYLSAICILELERGTLMMERRDTIQGASLRAWLRDKVLPAFEDRILVVDNPVAQSCVALHVPNPCSHRDSLIAATALVHNMTVVTRKVSHFESTGAMLLNPWEI